MSASREKKNRLSQPKVTKAEAPKKSTNKCMKRALTVIVTLILVAAVVFLGMVSTGFFQKHTVAAVVNGHKLTPVMFNYFYSNAYVNLQDAMQFDTEKPLREQEAYGMNLEDYVLDYAVDSATNIYAIYDDAIANGFALNEEEMKNIDSELDMMDLYAQIYGFTDGASMLVSQYGPGADKESYREYLLVSQTASAYANSIQEGFTYTEEDLNAYYAEHVDEFNFATFRQFSVTPDTLQVEADEAGLAACKEAADIVAAAAEQGEEAFLDAVVSVMPEERLADYDADATTLRTSVSYTNFAEVYSEWMSDEARKEGDVATFDNGDFGQIVLYYISRSDSDYMLPNVRHILISAADTSDAAAMAEAKAEAEMVLETYLAGEQTEEAFAALAKEHSDDNGEEGGLYENITIGTMVEAFENWCYDSNRQVGDTGIVETEYGYHVMYFPGYGRSNRDYTIENKLRYEDYTTWYDALIVNNENSFNESARRYVMGL